MKKYIVFSFVVVSFLGLSLLTAEAATTLNSCGDITQQGDYVLGADINSPNTILDSCIKFKDANNVTLDCQNHTITADNIGESAVSVKGSSYFKIYNCKLQSNSVSSSISPLILGINDSIHGELYNNTLGLENTIIMGSSFVTIRNSTFTNNIQVENSNNITIKDNNFSSGKPAYSILLKNGSNNSVISNFIDGKSDGVSSAVGFGDSSAGGSIGTDDGITILNESDDLIQGNILQNFFDCGIENGGYIFDSKIIGNNIKNTGICGIGGEYDSSVRGNLIKDNIIEDSPEMFHYSLNTFKTVLPPTEQHLYFKDNTFENNKFKSTRKSNFSSSFLIDNSILSSRIIVGNNIFKNNSFTTKALFFEPISMIVDAGGNTCHAPTADEHYPPGAGVPLNCGSLSSAPIVTSAAAPASTSITPVNGSEGVPAVTTLTPIPVASIRALTDQIGKDSQVSSGCVGLRYNLKYRSRDASTNGEVSDLQDFLVANGYLSGEPTGYFGLMTVTAVKKFQAAILGAANTTPGYGGVGPKSRAKIKAMTCQVGA